MKKLILILASFCCVPLALLAQENAKAIKKSPPVVRFVCSKGDFSDTKAGKCPKHQLDLINTNDKNNEAVIKLEADKDNTAKRNLHSVTERFVCVKGDFSDVKRGNCPKHNQVLVSVNDPNTAALIQAEIKNDVTAKRGQNITRFVCSKGDYSSLTSGKCPTHGNALIDASNEEAMKTIKTEDK